MSLQDFFTSLLLAVISAAVPVIAAFFVSYIKKAKENIAASTDDIKMQGYLEEIMNAISDAVAATSQTYVDALKKQGSFTLEAQKEAASKALTACVATISPAATAFIEAVYGNAKAYLMNKIEAEVRRQKFEQPATLALPAVAELESIPDTTTIAASTAAATAATVAQVAISQYGSQTPPAE